MSRTLEADFTRLQRAYEEAFVSLARQSLACMRELGVMDEDFVCALCRSGCTGPHGDQA
jgi:hypothetical protein